MKTLKVLLQEVVSGIKAWVNSNFAQESNTVHKTGNETVNGVKTFTGNVIQNQAGGTNVYCATCDGAVKGDLTSSGTFSIVCKDGSNENMETSGLAAVYMGQDTSGSYVALRADTSYNNTRYNAAVSLDIDPTTANNNAIFRPRRDNTIDLGSSSYQFKNLYANNYYYKGTAWGLDKMNVWSASQIISNNNAALILKNPEMTLGVTPTSSLSSTLSFHDVNNTSIGYIQLKNHNNSNSVLSLVVKNKNGTDSYDCALRFRITKYGDALLYPENAPCDLGSASLPFKTINGVNPGALSLPEGSDSESIAVDITDWYIQDPDYPDDPTKKILDATNHKVDTAVPGWLHINFPNVAGNWAYARKYAAGTNMALQRIADGNASSDFTNVALIFPIHSSCYVRIKAKTATVRIFPCLGNV